MLRSRLGADTRIELLPLLFRCTSVDLLARAPYLHRSGTAWEAVAASSRLPAVLPPLRLDGRLHVDGGLLDNLPIGALTERPEGPIIAVNVTGGGTNGAARPPGHVPRMPSLGETLMRSMLIATGGVDGARAARACIVAPAVAGVGLAEFHLMDRMVEAGRAAARALLEQTGGVFTAYRP